MGKNAEPQKERPENEPGQMTHCLHEETEDISTLLARSTRVSRRVTRLVTQLDYCLHANACKYLTAKRLPAAVIQPGLKNNPGSCKEALNQLHAQEIKIVKFTLLT